MMITKAQIPGKKTYFLNKKPYAFKMKINRSLLLIFSMLIFLSAQAQEKKIQLEIIAEFENLTNQNQNGFGGFVKGLYSINKRTAVTLISGISKFHFQESKTTLRMIPFLAGLKKNFKVFYFEPSIGIGELGGKVDIGGDRANPSVAAIFLAWTTGLEYKRFDAGVRYQYAKGLDNAGLWHDKEFAYDWHSTWLQPIRSLA
jgi:hypothetical protein